MRGSAQTHRDDQSRALQAGQRAAQAHTGALVGSDTIIDAVLQKHGVLRVHSLDEMIETLCIMHARHLPKGNGFGAITFSGGAVGVMSDLAADYGLHFPPIHEADAQQIRDVLYEYGTVNNPIDLTGQAVYDPPVQRAAFEAMGGSKHPYHPHCLWWHDVPGQAIAHGQSHC